MKLNTLLEKQELIQPKAHDRTVNNIARSIVSKAIKDFVDEDELPAAKKMARGFGKRLLKAVEDEYRHMKLRDVTPTENEEEEDEEHKLSLSR